MSDVLSVFCVVKLQALRFLAQQCRSCGFANVCSVMQREEGDAFRFA